MPSRPSNTAYGTSSLSRDTTGNYNAAFGFYALPSNTTGDKNTGFGDNVMQNNVSGDYNTAFGLQAAVDLESSDDNTAFGLGALGLLDQGLGANDNTGVGVLAGPQQAGECCSVAVEYEALGYASLLHDRRRRRATLYWFMQAARVKIAGVCGLRGSRILSGDLPKLADFTQTLLAGKCS